MISSRPARAFPRQTITRLGTDVAALYLRSASAGEHSDDMEAVRLARWWDDLSEARRHEVFGLAPHNPMPLWMVNTLQRAEISGLVEREGEPDDMPPWIEMPAHVARLIACRRRHG